ncbi:MAG: hypothetical protein WCG37_11345 [Actinomycetes bacterium]
MGRNQIGDDRRVIRTFLKTHRGEASFSEIDEGCSKKFGRSFGPQRIRRAVKWDTAHPVDRSVLRILPGGKACRLVENSELVGIGLGAKADAVRVLDRESIAIRKVFTHKGSVGAHLYAHEVGKMRGPVTGTSSRPDIIVGVKMTEQSRRPVLHNIEFQGKNPTGQQTFHVSDVAQSFVAGRGADYSWVLIPNEVRRTKQDPKYDDWERVIWLAGVLGVGIISYRDPHLVSTWRVLYPAKYRSSASSSSDDRSLYLEWWEGLHGTPL